MRQDPITVVMKDMFFQNAFPYLEVRRPFILGTRARKWKATLSHRFAELLHKRTGKLTRLYTQNIDGLDYQCELPSDKIVAVHGSIGRVACEGCVIVQQCLRCWEYSLGVVCGGGVGLT